MAFEFQPTLEDSQLVLRPLKGDDFDALYAVAADPELWAQHPARDRYRHDVFVEFFDVAMRSGSALVIIDRRTDQVIGSSRYNGLDAEAGEIEIGWTFISRSCWGDGTNAAVKKLMLSHAFKFVDTVVFWVGSTNIRSRRAVEKLGAVLRDENAIRGGSPHVVYALEKPRDEY
jgi:RimJ/RimL family protein N-acetyltransferase